MASKSYLGKSASPQARSANSWQSLPNTVENPRLSGGEYVNGLLAVVCYRLKGMTQAETVKLAGLSLGTVQKHEHLMREHGLVFPWGKVLSELSACEIGEMFLQADKKRARRGTGSHQRRIK